MTTKLYDEAAPRKLAHFINGKLYAGDGQRWGDIFNPATGEVVSQVPLGSTADVDAALAAATAALPGWADTTPLRRARIMFKFKELLEKNADEIAAMITHEHGKVLSDAKGELTRGIEVVEFACGIPHLLKGEYSDQVGGGVDSWSIRQPVGVCAGITPFNFPVMVPMWMFPVALACGNTFILKPSERDPSPSLMLAELLREAGLPEGVFNVVHGDKTAVDALLTDPRVAAVSFVGSTPIAQYIYSTGTAHGKRVQALGGAKNHMVVMPDADLDLTVDSLMGAAYGSAGERCMAISVAVAVGDIADELVKRMAEKTRNLNIGPGTDPKADMGPLVTRTHYDKVKAYVDQGVKEGAKLVVDGRDFKVAGHEGGFFLGGCMFDDVKPSMQIYKEEIFGPVLSVVRVPDLGAAINLINTHEFGNGVAVFTSSGNTAREFSRRISVGMVGINVPIPVPMAFHSFGGWKHSLFGDHSVHGPEGVRFYTRLKTMTARWPQQGELSANPFIMPTH
ncbi:MAG: CoA-acylating methylmalonate-semialdehyde dehydrogenase [Gammaproteobacteria bacterium]|nr:CoA-acylating methylmalonate-semialdehyde dehydrogenase [Rhodocyclaceae bacterium]MBU3907681.1 CoA-acylating methylmalonate-semialdehyde dehydrogenase [Gammaproteobacteria bacterium]MBU3989226.1 CoA-acylating methylmalonate-semialdehyde dehydrogenase [Gammaproteobacteria bacterium]MBU4004327.1 CoA-acylating methylmalonate-semialdehyde dehydrogenase [Gammaproteobacteria bacterium]MBU4019736.1 CoA-acylating methylmalonate-semialdehyde dehydrogenase [Gammaproteobacteria bacterium]